MQIDRERALRELDIPGEMFDELLGIFIEQAEPALKALEEAVQAGDYEEIRRNAHFIKGSAGNLRIDGVQEIAREMEFAAKEKQGIALIGINAVKLKTAVEEVKKEVSGG